MGWFTCDGAAVNGTTLREFAKEISITDDGWDAREHDILYVFFFFFFFGPDLMFLAYLRCMEHSLHLAAKHFVEVISPVSLASIRKKATAALKLAREGGHLNMEELDKALYAVDAGDNNTEDGYSSGDGDGYDDETAFTPGDALGKALALVKQVVHSLFACAFAHYIIRFVCHLKREHSSSRLAFRSASSLLNSFSGFVHDGRHFTSSLIGCWCCRR